MFPELNITQRENILGGSSEVSTITHVDVLNGDETSEQYQEFREAGSSGYTGAEAINRSTDTVYIYGRRLDSVTEVQILDEEPSEELESELNIATSLSENRFLKVDSEGLTKILAT